MSRPFWFLDSRSLGLFRLVLGAVALYTFVQLAADAAAFFGPGGTLPADYAWNGYTVKPWLFSLLFAFPKSFAPVILMFALGFVGSLLVLLGPGARIGSLVAWWAFGSLAVRNPLILHAGDSLLSIMLLFAAFFPVNRHFALRRSTGREPILVSNFWSTVWIVQIGVVYLAAGIVKAVTPSWLDGSHLLFLFNGTELVTPVGQWMAQFPLAARIGTITSLVFEFALGILILVLPSVCQRARVWLVAIGICFHLMIALTLQVGLFPIYSLAALSTFLPPLFWERLKRRRGNPAQPLPAIEPTPARKWQMAAAMVVAAAVAWIGIGYASPRVPKCPRPIEAAFYQFHWKNNWNVFAETPSRRTRLGVELVLGNGERIDLMEGRTLVPSIFESLPSESDRFGGSRWRFLLFGNFVNRPQLRPLAAHYLTMKEAEHADNPALRGALWELVLYSAPLPREERLRLTREVISVYQAPSQANAPASP